jgi:hypothetical protein
MTDLTSKFTDLYIGYHRYGSDSMLSPGRDVKNLARPDGGRENLPPAFSAPGTPA